MIHKLINQINYLNSCDKYEEAKILIQIVESKPKHNLRFASKNNKKTLWSIEYPNYTYKKEIWSGLWGSPDFEIDACYSNIDDSYIGDPKFTERLCLDKGIIPEKSDPEHNVSTIGFCPKSQTWWGWSHRAMKEFGIGDKGELCTPIPLKNKYPEAAKTLEDAKNMAIAFAESVS